MHESPGQQNRADAERNLVRPRRVAELCNNRGEAGERCRRRKHQKSDCAFVIDSRPVADAGDRRSRREPVDKDQIERHAAVPTDQDARRHAPGHGQQQQNNRDAERGRNEQAGMEMPEPYKKLQFAWLTPIVT